MANQYDMTDLDYAIYQAEYDEFLKNMQFSSVTLQERVRQLNIIERQEHERKKRLALERIRELRRLTVNQE